MNCPSCNKPIEPEWKTCPYCETKLGTTSTADRAHPLQDGRLDPTIADGSLSSDAGEFTGRPNAKNQDGPDGMTRITGDGTGLGAAGLSDRYELLSEIGRGGMGLVYRARHRGHGRIDAVKRILVNDSKAMERFRREARTIVKLNHPNIVTVYDAGEDEEGPWLSMELVEGGRTLKDHVAENKVVSEGEVESIARCLCNALADAHRAGLIHRDVKPGNILMAKDGTPKLSDFGLAREGESSELSMTGMGMGTVSYAAPEQLQDAKGVDLRADIYALGATLYHLLTGKTPKIIHIEKIPERFRALLTRALSENPEDRFGSMEEMRSALDKPVSKSETVMERIDGDHCPNCGYLVSNDMKFCEHCRAGLCMTCPGCKREVRIKAKYCGNCGADLAAWINSEKLFQEAREYVKSQNYGDALKSAEAALTSYPDRQDVGKLLAETRKILDSIHQAREEAADLEKEGRFSEAMGRIRDLLKRCPEDREADRALERLTEKIRIRDYNKAQNEFQGFVKKRDWTSAKTALDTMRAYAGVSDKNEIDESLSSIESTLETLRRRLLNETREDFESNLALNRFEDCRSILEKSKELNESEEVLSARFSNMKERERLFRSAVKRKTIKSTVIGFGLVLVIGLVYFGYAWYHNQGVLNDIVNDFEKGAYDQVNSDFDRLVYGPGGGDFLMELQKRSRQLSKLEDIPESDFTKIEQWITQDHVREKLPLTLGRFKVEADKRELSNRELIKTISKEFSFLEEKTFFCGGESNRVKLFLHKKTGLEFVLIPGGSFMMGSPSDERGRYGDEDPLHRVTIMSFLLCRSECAQEAWDRIGGEDSRSWRGKTLPIDSVSWNDCTAWCRKAGLRLPTEAEWEYACRGGKTGRFCFGDEDSGLGKYAWYGDNSGSRTHPVGEKSSNAFGLYDMHGNVWEWVQDVYHGNYEGALKDGTAWEDGGSGNRVGRGGSWGSGAGLCRSACRYWGSPGRRDCGIGFRPALSLP